MACCWGNMKKYLYPSYLAVLLPMLLGTVTKNTLRLKQCQVLLRNSEACKELNMMWELPTVVRKSPLMCTDKHNAPYTNSSSQSTTTTLKQPFYMAHLKHCTGSCSPHCCDMLRSSTYHRAVSCMVTRDKRQGIPSTQSFIREE